VPDVILLIIPLAVLALVAVLGFVGCTRELAGFRVEGGEGPGQHPIAYWRLSDSDPLDPQETPLAKDEVGASLLGDHPGTYLGNVTLGVLPGLNAGDPVATPARFDGTGTVVVPHWPEFEMEKFTVAALVRPDNVVAGPGEIVRNMSATGGWALSITPPPPDKPGTDGYFVPSVRDGAVLSNSSAGFELAQLGTASHLEIAWHLAMTFDGAVLILYKDGEVAAAVAGPYAPNTPDYLEIGVNFQGAIQEVVVYKSRLEPEEIKALYMSTKSPNVGP
jgi:hypothetical protein